MHEQLRRAHEFGISIVIVREEDEYRLTKPPSLYWHPAQIEQDRALRAMLSMGESTWTNDLKRTRLSCYQNSESHQARTRPSAISICCGERVFFEHLFFGTLQQQSHR